MKLYINEHNQVHHGDLQGSVEEDVLFSHVYLMRNIWAFAPILQIKLNMIKNK
jgi:hypothetical protein